ncbi:hypothetical protein ACJMK2_042504 [Sinanodonta woodiana]|uniref:THAP-type domain-containing protein n=1 Tax=Sinanodonta woodiana TaxID=1069815 RepID=A0ABD3W7M0_SINWO
MGRDYCTVFGCHNFSGRIGKFGHKVTLHKLPKEQYARRAWIHAISRKNWIPSNYTRVCSDHFISENLPQKRSGAVKTLRSSPSKRPQPQTSDKTSFNDLNLPRKLSSISCIVALEIGQCNHHKIRVVK